MRGDEVALDGTAHQDVAAAASSRGVSPVTGAAGGDEVDEQRKAQESAHAEGAHPRYTRHGAHLRNSSGRGYGRACLFSAGQAMAALPHSCPPPCFVQSVTSALP